MNLPKRKPLRLKGYDYSRPGWYFVTICTRDRAPLFRRGAHCAPASMPTPAPVLPPLSSIGETVEQAIADIPTHYPGVKVDRYVVMPNHVHMVVVLGGTPDGRTMCAPTADLSRIIRMMKGAVTKRVGRKIWQRGYYDHIIRDEADYLRVWEYIETNPGKWREDAYFVL